MSDEKRSYLVAYDINDDRRRDHVAKYYGAMARGCSIACSFCGFGLRKCWLSRI